MSEDRGLLGDTWAFTKSGGSGIWNAGAGMVEGAKGLAKGGYKLVTDAEAREKAWETTKQLADATKEYGEAVYDDPWKAYRDARDGGLASIDKFEEARDLAEAEGRLAEFYGEMTGAGFFEVGTALIPIGLAAKAGKLGKVVNVADDVIDVAKSADKVEDVLDAAGKTERVLDKPVIIKPDAKCRSVSKCSAKAGGVKNLSNKNQKIFDDIYAKAPDAKREIDGLADEIADSVNGKVAKAPIKSKDRAVEKIVNDYEGDPSKIKDLARNTIITSDKDLDSVVAQLREKGANVKIIDGKSDPLGYSGVNTTVKTNKGLTGEIQVNTPEMIYAKEPESMARVL
ncbi:MAG: hypothetical protein KAG45_10650, partial [Methyloprofundus sp.]|nr:hypothetical protein [Methyloprofundus sp.]